jgi:hypothetical protein
MERLSTPKQRASAALKIVRYTIRRSRRNTRDDQQQETSNVAPPSKYLKRIDGILDRATKAVFKKAGLNIDDSEDWKFLLPWLAWAIYGKNPGHPKRWNKKELRQLKADVAELRSKNTTLTEAACCEQLTKDIHYVGLKGRTLRRRLQQAKRLNTKQKV